MAYELPFGRFYLVPPTSPSPSSIVLEQSSDTPGGGWRFTLSLLSGSQLRVVLGRASSVGTMEGGLKRKEHMPSRKMEGLKVSEEALDGEEGREGGDELERWAESRSFLSSLPQIDKEGDIVSFTLPQAVQVTLSYSACPILKVVDSVGRIIHRDFSQKGFVFEGTARDLARPREEGDREGGVSWYSEFDQESICMGLGEKAAPINLSRRKFELRAVSLVSSFPSLDALPSSC